MLYNHRLVPVSDRFAIANVLVEELSKKYSSVLDLGAGHCRFSQMAHKWGMKVTAMDARTVRRPKLPTDIAYVEGNFLEVDVPGDFDVILMLGIFYHLSLNEQHILMGKYKGKPSEKIGAPVVTEDGFQLFIVGKRLFRKIAKYEDMFDTQAFMAIRHGEQGDIQASYELKVLDDAELAARLLDIKVKEFQPSMVDDAVVAAIEVMNG